ncbi:hypothetical protein [Peribacillus frigoritolerans]|uniref:hypothetical protein n=1 Tax=Peribacillus frigoritolerans TaxID=450367 RepID=UPI002E1E0C05|nr:hypothetical protein [Peribacillus frigoritolerans]MED3849646.1 hypothetical protein [Peribacillus frigoritolerans]
MMLKHFLLYSVDDEGIAEVDKNLSFQSRCITSLYERCFSKFHTTEIKQINIFCVKENPKPNLTIIDGFCDQEILYDVVEFFKLDDQEKKEVILDKLKQGIDKVVKLNNWESTPFDDAYNCVKEAGYKTNYVWKKPKSSPNRNYKAEVIIKHSLFLCEIYLIVKDKNRQEIAKKLVASEKPDELLFRRHLGELKWLSNNEVVLFNSSKTNYVSVQKLNEYQ